MISSSETWQVAEGTGESATVCGQETTPDRVVSDRPLRQHPLVWQLVQMSLDAVQDTGGIIALEYYHDGHEFVVECHDSGRGIGDADPLDVVQLNGQGDSPVRRGRHGHGLKEVLSVATSGKLLSGTREISFWEDDGCPVIREGTARAPVFGTSIIVTFGWGPKTLVQLDADLKRLLVPDNVRLSLNGWHLSPRPLAQAVEAVLPTEIFNAKTQCWVTAPRGTTIELVEARDHEVAFLYELGLPVAPLEWSQPYHANVLQRVPMMLDKEGSLGSYVERIHQACLHRHAVSLPPLALVPQTRPP